MEVKAVVFDLDDTLLDRRRSFERFIRNQWERFAQSLHTLEQERYVQAAVRFDADGYAPRKELFARVIAQFQLPLDMAETLLSDYRTGFPSACVLFPDAALILASLRASGLKLGLITNGSVRMQSRKLDWLALARSFDTILISDAEGIRKPDPRIFHRAMERLNVAPARSAFVGDNPVVDMAGARGAGMHAIWRRDPRVSAMVEADAVIDELSDLPSVLGLEHILERGAV
jgi:putative hydrolase of the HAD superfamily